MLEHQLVLQPAEAVVQKAFCMPCKGCPYALLQVPEEVRQARRDQLVSQQQQISTDFAESLVGTEVLLQLLVLPHKAPVLALYCDCSFCACSCCLSHKKT